MSDDSAAIKGDLSFGTSVLAREISEALGILRNAKADVTHADVEVHRVEKTLNIRRPDALLGTVELLTNTSAYPLHSVRRAIVGDAPADFDKLGFRAWVRVRDGVEQEAAVTCDGYGAGRMFQVVIGFRGLVAHPGDGVALRYELKWEGAVARAEDYWIFGFASPTRVSAAKIATLFVGGAPVDYTLYGVTPQGNLPIGLPGVLIDSGEGGVAYRCETRLTDPQDFYVLRWRLR